jgi:hypothetical protein
LAFSAAVAIPAVASAETAEFDIWNLTGGDITLYAYDQDPDKHWYIVSFIPDVPKVGTTVITPGKNLHISAPTPPKEEITVRVIPRLSGRAQTPEGQAQDWRVSLEIQNGGLGNFPKHAICSVGGDPKAKQTAACGNYIGKGNNVATLADGPGTKVTIPASDAQKQTQIKQDMCGNPYKDALGITCNDSADALTVAAANTVWTLPKK